MLCQTRESHSLISHPRTMTVIHTLSTGGTELRAKPLIRSRPHTLIRAHKQAEGGRTSWDEDWGDWFTSQDRSANLTDWELEEDARRSDIFLADSDFRKNAAASRCGSGVGALKHQPAGFGSLHLVVLEHVGRACGACRWSANAS